MSTLVTSGDDLAIPITLKIDGSPYAVDVAATVRAAFVHPVNMVIVTTPVALDSGATGADWATGLVVMEMTSAESSPLASYAGKDLEIEVEVDDPTVGKRTWRVEDVQVRKGLIN